MSSNWETKQKLLRELIEGLVPHFFCSVSERYQLLAVLEVPLRVLRNIQLDNTPFEAAMAASHKMLEEYIDHPEEIASFQNRLQAIPISEWVKELTSK